MRQVLEMVGLWDRKDSLVSTYQAGCSDGWRSRGARCTRRTCCSWTSPPSASTREIEVVDLGLYQSNT